MTTHLITGILASGMLIWSSAAAAAPVAKDAPATEQVRYGDLDLSRVSDQATLKRRVAKAAEQVCEEIDWNAPWQPTRVNSTCYQAAVQSAILQVNRAAAGANYTATLAVAARK
jgi:UrcA family protein